MFFIKFSEAKLEGVSDSKLKLGGKGKTLARLAQESLPVPEGAILTRMPETEEEWQSILKWWEDIGQPKLAIRSSAIGEDSEDYSFAGQNSSFLNVDSEAGIRDKVARCFESLKGEASTTYRKHFLKDAANRPTMNVVLQQMVQPLFSGVYFSKDPRSTKENNTWLFEVVEGLGESLVSGKVTPYLFTQDKEPEKLPDSWTSDFSKQLIETGQKVSEFLNYELDMEWAIDKEGRFYVLQARPITSLNAEAQKKKYIDYEVKRLQKTYSTDVVWDGKTFAEWGGFPSYATFSIWKNVFSPRYAFGEALRKLGYLSFVNKEYSPKDSALERIFGRAYINLEKVGALYYGDIPYKMVGRPKARLVFDWSKLGLMTILRGPAAMWRMTKVAIALSTQRKKWIQKGRRELLSLRQKLQRTKTPEVYRKKDYSRLLKRLEQESQIFAKETLIFPLILVILSESTMRSLFEILKGFYDSEKKANNKINAWLSSGLHTQTYQMNQDFKEACLKPEKRKRFLKLYGHRGPGELDLVNPRWSELGEEAFSVSTLVANGSKADANEALSSQQEFEEDGGRIADSFSVEEEIKNLKTLKKDIILQEWKLLKNLLELREQWKMEMLRPYAQIRYILTEIGERKSLGNDIHWLRLSEILKLEENQEVPQKLLAKIQERKERFHVFKKTSFPEVISLSEIEAISQGKVPEGFHALEGEGLSSGMLLGTVLVVEDPLKVKAEDFTEDTILVAEAVDPGWTPLFVQAKAVVIEKGGVLSHCAILARELGMPAVSGIYQCHKRLKTGDRIWVDGYNGVVTYEH